MNSNILHELLEYPSRKDWYLSFCIRTACARNGSLMVSQINESRMSTNSWRNIWKFCFESQSIHLTIVMIQLKHYVKVLWIVFYDCLFFLLYNCKSVYYPPPRRISFRQPRNVVRTLTLVNILQMSWNWYMLFFFILHAIVFICDH